MIWPPFEETDDLLFYVEKFSKIDGIVLIDPIDSNNFSAFTITATISYSWEERPTMIEFINYSGRQLREGVTYRLNRDMLATLIQRIAIVEDSLVIGFRIDLKFIAEDIFGPSFNIPVARNLWLRVPEAKPSPTLEFREEPSEVIIRSIGQGSWNEIKSDNQVLVIFDLGTIYTTKTSDLLRMIGDRDALYQQSNPTVIIFTLGC
jgi:hypothetical protein